jgi:hypothetical protein
MHHFGPNAKPAIHGERPTKEGGNPNPCLIILQHIGHTEMVKSRLISTPGGIGGKKNDNSPEGGDGGDFETHSNVA